MIKNVKIQVSPEQTRLIQKVVFENSGTWENKTKTCDWLIITAGGDISWATTDTLKCYSEISAEDWLKDSNPEVYLISESTQEQHEIEQGTIVLATRKSTNEKLQDYTWQATYYGKFNEHYLVDFNGTHYQIADEIKLIPTLTKKEAKQKVSELFSQPNKVTSDKIRNIIDLIKD